MTPFVFEIHGNVNYMRCSREDLDHSRKIVKSPSIGDFEAAAAAAPESTITGEDGVTQNFCLVPRCPECDAPMKP